eukprot:TRINITY_DN2182_c0_g1_i2.p1 TRINITY_DN2182_c0_g1~~TRINITY_DN2182_c0_g1_i2.p1  ORF type:complete len:540 (-),score=187.34 TRINITY_DN2182_c0_g1_i2:173-1792(-)
MAHRHISVSDMALPWGICSSLLVSLVLVLAPAAAAASDEAVLTLDASNFAEALESHDFLVAEFYAPWCGHCQKLAPEYEKAAKAIKEEGLNIVLAKIDADNTENKQLAQSFGVHGYPTLKIFRKGVSEPMEYEGPRDADGIVKYLKKESGPAAVEISSKSKAEEVLGDNEVVVVGVFTKLEGEEYENFTTVANSLRSASTFAYTVDPSVLPKAAEELKPLPTVRLFKEFDEGFSDFTSFEIPALKHFVQTKSLPVIVEMSSDPSHRDHIIRAFDLDSPKVLLFFDYAGEEERVKLKEEFMKVAKAESPQSIFFMGDAPYNKHALQYFGVEEDTTVPVLCFHVKEGQKKWVYTNISASEIADYMSKFNEGKLHLTLKSEPVPESNNEAVKVVVANTFNDLIVNSGKNVLIEFYAPWCGHCQKLEPIYKKLAEAFENDTGVIIAKMDATANDIPHAEMSVSHFPTIYFLDTEGKVQLYPGDRTKAAMVKFINEHRTDGAPPLVVEDDDDAASEEEGGEDEIVVDEEEEAEAGAAGQGHEEL